MRPTPIILVVILAVEAAHVVIPPQHFTPVIQTRFIVGAFDHTHGDTIPYDMIRE